MWRGRGECARLRLGALWLRTGPLSLATKPTGKIYKSAEINDPKVFCEDENFTETAEWRGKGIASGGRMPKQQKGKSKYFVSFGVPKYLPQCSLPWQAPGKASSNSPPKCSTSPTADCLPSMKIEATQELLPMLKAPFQGTGGACGSGGREGSWGMTCSSPVPDRFHCLPARDFQSYSKSYSNYHRGLFGTKNCHPIPLLGMKVTESQKPFLMYNWLPVNLQV